MDEPGRKDANRYRDILDVPYPFPTAHRRMPRADRAAQFSPFAALTGYEAAIGETARLTEGRLELDEDRKMELDARLRLLQAHLREQPEVAVTYFQPDERKPGGAYRTAQGTVQKIDPYRQTIRMADGTLIAMADLCALEGALFAHLEVEQ